MASMRASPLSPRSHFPLSASFFPAACSPPVSMERQSFIGPRQSRGALYKKRALSAAMVALLRLPIPGRSSAGGEAADHLLISPVYGGGKGAPSAPPHRAIPPLPRPPTVQAASLENDCLDHLPSRDASGRDCARSTVRRFLSPAGNHPLQFPPRSAGENPAAAVGETGPFSAGWSARRIDNDRYLLKPFKTTRRWTRLPPSRETLPAFHRLRHK